MYLLSSNFYSFLVYFPLISYSLIIYCTFFPCLTAFIYSYTIFPLYSKKIDKISLVYFVCMRQCPTLPDRFQSSTISAEELNFCVRYVYRWTSSPLSPHWLNVLPYIHNYIVSFLKKFALKSLVSFLLCSSPRPISIGQLNALLHLHTRPINLVVFKGSY